MMPLMGFKAASRATPTPRVPFGPELFGFLIELSVNNNREWFQENKSFYEGAVKAPLLSFIEEFAPHLQTISKNFRADSRSMFRIYRDVRFSKDKRPPRGFDPDHPLIETIKRKDFLALVELDDSDILAPARVANACKQVAPLNRWICQALGVPF